MKTRIAAIISIVTVWLVGCGPSESESKIQKPLTLDAPLEVAKASKSFDSSQVEFKGPGLLLAKSYGAWSLSAEPRYFGAENLYDLIDGGAEVFVGYGFKQIVTADYMNENSPTQTVNLEIYDMGTPLGAFGRVSKYLENIADPSKAGDGLPAELSDFGIKGDGDVLAWKDKFIAHLTLMDQDPGASIESITAAASGTLPGILQSIFANIKEEAKTPEEINVFPTHQIVWRSFTWQADKTLGYENLPAGFTARYKVDEKTGWILFYTDEFESEDAAKEAMAAISRANPVPLMTRLAGKRVAGALSDGMTSPSLEQYEPSLKELVKNLETK